MHSALVGPWQRMGEGKERAIERVGALPPDARVWSPPDGGWRAIDIVEHLVLVEAGLASALAKEPNPERPRALGAGGRYPFWVVRFVLLTGIRRIRVPVDAVQPRGGVEWEPLLERWAEERRKLEQWLEEAPPEVVRAPRFKHPLTGWLDVPEGLTFAADHLVHHLRQVGRVERGLRRG